MRYAARSGCPTPPQYRELPDHYRWVPDSLADDQVRVNRQHEYINEALAEAAFRVFGADSGVKPGDRFSLSEVISKLAGYDNGDFGEPEKVSSRWQSEAKKTLLQTGLFSYDRTGRVGRRKPFVYESARQGNHQARPHSGQGLRIDRGSALQIKGRDGSRGCVAVLYGPMAGSSDVAIRCKHHRVAWSPCGKCAESWGRDRRRPVHFGVPIDGHSRAVVILPHPNAHTRRKLGDHVSPEDLGRLQALV